MKWLSIIPIISVIPLHMKWSSISSISSILSTSNIYVLYHPPLIYSLVPTNTNTTGTPSAPTLSSVHISSYPLMAVHVCSCLMIINTSYPAFYLTSIYTGSRKPASRHVRPDHLILYVPRMVCFTLPSSWKASYQVLREKRNKAWICLHMCM